MNPILKQLSDYYVILAEADGHSEQTDELVSLEKNCDEIESFIINNLSGNLYFSYSEMINISLVFVLAGTGRIHSSKLTRSIGSK